MTTRMKINEPLTPDLADKWKRLLASQGGDPEALAFAAVELLWKKYGKDVVKFERDDLAYRKKLAAEYVRTVRPKKRKGAHPLSGDMTKDELVRYLAEGSDKSRGSRHVGTALPCRDVKLLSRKEG